MMSARMIYISAFEIHSKTYLFGIVQIILEKVIDHSLFMAVKSTTIHKLSRH